MLVERSCVIAVRSLLVPLCLALLAGCGGASGSGTDSAPAAVTPDPTVSIPAAPADLAATAGNAQASLAWSASTGATSYSVKRSTTTGGPYTQLATSTSPSYTDSTARNGTTYFYVVSALNSAGESANSAQTSVTPDPTITTPNVPTGLTAAAGNAQVALTWSASTTGATSYHVKRATKSGGPYTQIAAPTSASYTDASLTNGTTYYYVVSALDSAGESPNSAQVSATPVASATVPAAPTGLSGSAGSAQVSLTWAATTGATSYHVKRATQNGGPYTQIAAPTSASYIDTSLTNGTTYYYVVSALNSNGESTNSAQVAATPTAPAPPPTTFGTWNNVTPAGVDLTGNLSCGNFGTEAVQVDPMHPSNLYTSFNCQGIWKSTDYGATWTGPINTGTNGATVSDCAGGITIPPHSTASTPTIYESCIRGSALGFWKSVDGGVNWTQYFVAPSGASRQDYYPPVVDPYDESHLLMAGHEMNYLVESVDGGQTWSNVSVNSGMLENGGTAAIFFINTGNAASTRTTWLWLAQESGGVYGTWRTTNSGTAWVQVDKNEHAHGLTQLYQPDNNGVVYMVGAYSVLGWGVLRSSNYGQTWSHVGPNSNESTVFGTPKNVYAMFGYPSGPGGTSDPAFEIAAQPGTGSWVAPGTPAGLTQGSATVAVVNDGTHNILVGAMWNNGVWRYIEP
jgi:fibronectin type 3 domain-containing protein